MFSKRLAIALLASGVSTPAFAQATTARDQNGKEVVVPSPAAAGAIRVERDKILIAGGLVTFRIPAGWKEDSGFFDKFAVISGRPHSSSNPYPSAACRISLQQTPVPNSLTQADVNTRLLSQESKVAARSREKGTLREYSKDKRIGDAAVIRIVIADPTDAYSDNRQLLIVQDGQMTMLQADCNTALPEKAEDKRDMEAFLESAAIHRPS